MTFTFPDAVILGAVVEGIFYGAYVVLFILYLVLRRRNNHTMDGPLTLAQILLFSLCTLFFCLDISGDYFAVVPDAVNNDVANRLSHGAGSGSIFSVIDCLAQMILLYRCWIIWDKRWAVIAVPGFLALASLGAGLAATGLVASILLAPAQADLTLRSKQIAIVEYSISLGVNALSTLLIVTKILLISREVHPALGSDSHRSFRIATAMLIESGLLIFVSQLVYLVLFALLEVQPPPFGFVQGAITQIYGITPTLLNIRVIMGSSYDRTTWMVSSLKFVRPDGALSQSQAIRSSSAASIHTREINIRLDDVPDNRRTAENVV